MSMLTATILLAQLHCSPNASGTVDCWDAQKGGAPVLKVEPNLFGGYDLRQSDGKPVRCEMKPSGKTECRVVQGRKHWGQASAFRRLSQRWRSPLLVAQPAGSLAS